MKSYIKIYHKAFGYPLDDPTFFRPSEIHGGKSIDINHIDCRGLGGNPNGDKDRIENLIALTRLEHIQYGDKTKYKSFLFRKHKEFMIENGVDFDEGWIDEQIKRYEID